MQLAKRSWPEGASQLGLRIVALVACGTGLHGFASRDCGSTTVEVRTVYPLAWLLRTMAPGIRRRV